MKAKKPRRKRTRAENIILIIFVLSIIASIYFAIRMERYNIFLARYEGHKGEPLYLTQEEKLEDFSYFYDSIVSSFPMLEEYKETYGYDFEQQKVYYEELIRETESDYEFWTVMRAIANEFTSFHTNLVFPRYEQYRSLGCYNMDGVLLNKKVYLNSLYWDELLENEYNKEDMRGTVYVGYRYVNGEYISIVDIDGISKGTKLTEMDGMDIHDYIATHLSGTTKKKYDAQNNRIYLPYIYVNNNLGKPVTLTLISPQGDAYHREVYYEGELTTGLYLHRVYGDDAALSTVQNDIAYSYIDDKNNIGYIHIQNFYAGWEDVIISEMQKLNACDVVILDLRDNYGGSQMVARDCVYPYLFTEDTTITNKWYMIDSKLNKRIIREDITSLFFKFKFRKAEDVTVEAGHQYLYSVREYEYEGAAEKEKEVYVLIGPETGSAADGFAAALKDTSATIIGSNTGGEGLADSFVCDYLPNSGLVFTYMFGKASNADGTDNSTYGTAPDIYANISAEGYIKCQELYEEGIDPYTYESRLLWDDVLVEAIEKARKEYRTAQAYCK